MDQPRDRAFQGLPLLCLATVLEDLFPDDPLGSLVQVCPQGFGQLGELRPEDVVGKAGHDHQGHGGAALASLAIGIQAVAAAECQEELQVPTIA